MGPDDAVPAPDDPVPAPDLDDVPSFKAGLRCLKAWSGLSYRELERAAGAAGEPLPATTIADMLSASRPRMPRETQVRALVRACGGDEDQVAAWLRARRRIVVAEAAPPDARPVAPEDGPHGPADPVGRETIDPEFGPGCMGISKARTTPGPFVFDDYCAGANAGAEEFVLTPVARPVPGYTIRVARSGLCFGFPPETTRDGAPLYQMDCDDSAGQVFTMEAR